METNSSALPPRRRAHFIPIRKAELIRRLADRLAPMSSDRQHFLQLCRALEAMFHYEFNERLERLKDTYAPFDPDADTHTSALSEEERDELAARLFGRLESLLERANYERLSHDNVYQAVASVSSWGVNLDVDLEAFDLLEVYARGETVERRSSRRLRNLYKEREADVPMYQRLVVAFRPRPECMDAAAANVNTATPVFFKMFKGIPKSDLEMLLPGTRVRMTLVDRGRIVLPALSGIVITIHKVLTGALALAVAGVTGLLTFLGVIGGTVGYGVKSLLSYQRAKDKYQLTLARNLYYQNLDNNAGVLYRLLDEAEEQEFREAILAYFLLWQNDSRQGLSAAELDEAAECLLQYLLGMDIDFEVDDALAKLQRLKLVQNVTPDRLRAMSIDDALCRLDIAWSGLLKPAATTRPATHWRQDEPEDSPAPAARQWSSSPWG